VRLQTVVRLEIQDGTYRNVQDLLKLCQCGSWKASQHIVTVVQSQVDKCCDVAAKLSTDGMCSAQMVETREMCERIDSSTSNPDLRQQSLA